ncbi:MAG: DUF349 domain-containing protein [Cytophagales bacterium]|nr:DUF349 domain-containing protein [Cytophagales bacterium]
MENEKVISSSSESLPEEIQGGPEAASSEASAVSEAANEAAEEISQPEAEEETLSVEDIHPEEYEGKTKEELLKALSPLKSSNQFKYIDALVKVVREAYNRIRSEEREAALQKYVEEGGEKDDFYYRGDETDIRFDEICRLLKERKQAYYDNLEKTKQSNLNAKNLILSRLRELTEADETTDSLSEVRQLQEEWKKIGLVPSQHVQTLWANYKALLDRYYDKRSIYFELKELDRKKNFKLKIQLCEKAEALVSEENLQEAIQKLNELHEEYKAIGPVSRDEQEALWQRFKSASDQVYVRRKEFVEVLKKELKENLELKQALVEKVVPYAAFDSDRINDWNEKSKELMELQKQWDAIGGMPKEKSREVNRAFWASFKKFFSHKGEFFKRLEALRADNLAKKEELVAQAEALSQSEDMLETAEKLKQLQRDWKEIGPVPEKKRNEVYERFKKACDTFFDRKRDKNKSVEVEFEDNLAKKEAVCGKIDALQSGSENVLEEFVHLQEEFDSIGFVPRKAIKSIQRRYAEACQNFLDSVEGISDEEKNQFVMLAKLNKIKSGPNANSKLRKKEQDIRKQIADLENDIVLWKNNLEFFASSKTADKLRVEFDEKIQKAEAEIQALKKELRMLREMI